MTEQLDIIMLALPRWDGPYSSTAFSLAKELSKKNRVFYIDNPFTIKDLFADRKKSQIEKRKNALVYGKESFTKIGEGDQRLVAVTPRVTLPINFLSAGPVYDWLSRINDEILFSTIKKMLEEFDIEEYIFINVFNPFYAVKFPDFFRPRLFIYYSVDNIGHCAYVHRHGPRLEEEAVNRASFILATSRELTNNVKRKDNVHFLPNAADISLFLSDNYIAPPEEFRSITTPIIIYVGHIDQRIDFDLIKNILKSHPDKTLVMLGPHSIGEDLYNELTQFKNMKFLGRRDLAQLPHYLYYSHCCIIPFKCNEQTKSIYPLKINEYLATGRPVVSTPFSEDISTFSKLIYIGDSQEDFSQKISFAIEQDTVEQRAIRTKAVLENNWENRANEFRSIAGKYLAKEAVDSL